MSIRNHADEWKRRKSNRRTTRTRTEKRETYFHTIANLSFAVHLQRERAAAHIARCDPEDLLDPLCRRTPAGYPREVRSEKRARKPTSVPLLLQRRPRPRARMPIVCVPVKKPPLSVPHGKKGMMTRTQKKRRRSHLHPHPTPLRPIPLPLSLARSPPQKADIKLLLFPE